MKRKKVIKITGLVSIVSILVLSIFLLRQGHKEKLVWLNSDPCPESIIDALNDALSEAGCDYIIDYQVEDAYDKDYHSKLIQMKEQKKQVDILNIGGTDTSDESNMYREAIEEGLLSPIEEFLYNDERGKELYSIYHEKQWDGLTVDGHIYSYDWRCQPTTDFCAFINKQYADEWNIDVNNGKLSELFEIAGRIKEEKKGALFYPVIWGDLPEPDNYWNDKALMDQLNKWKQIVIYQQDIDWQQNIDFFIFVKDDYLIECSDTQILVDAEETPCDVYKYILAEEVYTPVTSNLAGIASWSEHREMALDFLYRVNTDKKIANLLQYGVEGENYEIRDKRAMVNYDNPSFGSFGIQNKWITLPRLLEPENKEQLYKEYITNHI